MQFFLLVFIFMLYSPTNIYSINDFEKDKIRVSFQWHNASAGSYYDLNSKLLDAYDSVYTFKVSDRDTNIAGIYNDNFQSQTARIRVEVPIYENLFIMAGMSFTSHKLTRGNYQIEEIKNERGFPMTKRNDLGFTEFSADIFDWSEIGLKYFPVLTDSNYYGFQFITRIPFGFHNGLFDDPKYEIMSDGAFQTIFSAMAAYQLETVILEGYANYLFRAEEFENQYQIGARFVLARIPNIRIYAFGEYANSLIGFDNAIPLNTMKNVTQESYLDGGFGLWVRYKKLMNLNFEYRLRPYGINSWRQSQIIGGVDFFF